MNNLNKYAIYAAIVIVLYFIVKAEIKAINKRREAKNKAVVIDIEESQLSRPLYFYRNLAIKAEKIFSPWEYNYAQKREILQELKKLSDAEFLQFISEFNKVSPDRSFAEYMNEEWFDPFDRKLVDQTKDRLNIFAIP